MKADVVECFQSPRSAYNQLLWLLEDIASLVRAASLVLSMDGSTTWMRSSHEMDQLLLEFSASVLEQLHVPSPALKQLSLGTELHPKLQMRKVQTLGKLGEGQTEELYLLSGVSTCCQPSTIVPGSKRQHQNHLGQWTEQQQHRRSNRINERNNKKVNIQVEKKMDWAQLS